MIDPDSLNVWHADRLVGYLWRDAHNRMGFRYDEAWLEDGFRLSLRLPLRPAPFPPEEVSAHAFFSNLLPEGGARERLLRARRLSDNDFVLLREFGGDCAGALSILPVEAEPRLSAGYTPLTDEALHRLVLQHGRGAYLPQRDEPQPRLSLAGAQDKCPVLREQGRYALPTGAAASSHILKFQVDEFADVPVNEAFMNRLARATNLPVPETVLERSGDEHFLVVRRFDRYREPDGSLHRLHQEDLFQALGPERYRGKYEMEGGPSFADCAHLIREVSEEPITDLRALLQWLVFNVLAGNADGHAKNLAIYQVEPESNRWRLAPFYDLVCTRAIDGIDTRLAMGIGGEFEPERITDEHWRALARNSGLPTRLVTSVREEMVERLREVMEPERQRFEAEFGHEIAKKGTVPFLLFAQPVR